ncbi:MAG: methanethiol S-methyltransferase [Qipengyuania sp.]
MARPLYLTIALLCYAAFFAAFLYLVGFVGGFDFMPTHVDKGLDAPPVVAGLVNAGLIALFGIQHSVMARQGFKRVWSKIVPKPVERSVYCLATVLALVALFAFWHPLPGTVWAIENEIGRAAMWAAFWAGWGILFVSTWLLNHFELFGLQQAWLHLRGREAEPFRMRTPLFYKWVRHPLYTGFLIAFWATPVMTWGHLLLAGGFTIYILIGIAHEERDLIDLFGEEYVAYRRSVGTLIPGVGRRA